jgi:hypothetical protein
MHSQRRKGANVPQIPLFPPEAVKKSIHGSRASPRTDFCVSSFKHLAVRPELCRRATAIFFTASLCQRGMKRGIFGFLGVFSALDAPKIENRGGENREQDGL